MSATWKTVRVFISSTFLDMHAERDYLVRFVFPRLREELLRRRIHFVDMDLRWGVSSVGALAVCREIVDECRPRFLCLLGGRYGEAKPDSGLSLTHEEVNYAVLDRLGQHGYTFFYFRDPTATDSIIEKQPGEFRDPPGSKNKDKLDALKKRIEDAGLNPAIYPARWDNDQRRLTNLGALGNRVYSELLDGVKSDPELRDRFVGEAAQPADEFAEENDAMEAFIGERTERYVIGSREPLLRKMTAFATADGTPNIFVLTGEPGSGKSALLARLTRDLAGHPSGIQHSALAIPHFVGASTGSTDLRRTLRRLCHELARAAGNTEPLPLDIKELITHFQKLLAEAAGRQHVILVFDALNQFDATDGAHWLNWLPRELPPGVRIVASVIAPADGQPEHQTLAILRTRPGTRLEKLEPLTEADTLAVIEGCLRRYAKRLSPEQLAALLAKPAGRLPLYVLTALEELRTLGAYEEITDRIRELPGDARALFGWILTERLARDPGFRDRDGRLCGAALVGKFAACLGVSRHGLSEDELAAILAPEPDGKHDKLGNVAALLRLLRPYLMRRGELLDFYHGQFREAAVAAHLDTPEKQRAAHQSVATCLQAFTDPHRDGQFRDAIPHALRELPYHLIALGDWDRLGLLVRRKGFLQMTARRINRDVALENADAITRALANAGEGQWDSFVACAEQYCDFAEELRSSPKALASWARNGEISRIEMFLKSDPSPFRRSLCELSVAVLLVKSDFWAAGEKLWAASLPVVRAHLATTESEVPGHTLATTVLARALTSPPGRQAVPNPSNRVLSAEAFPAPSAAIQPRSRMPWDLTVLAAVNSFALRFIKHSIAFIVPFVGFKLAIDYWTGPSRWLALLGGAMLFINLLVCLPLHLGLELLLSRLKRVGNGFAGLARLMALERAKTSPGRVEAESVTARRKGVFSEAIRFASRAGQEKPDESLAKERESYLCFLIAQGFDTVADDPREAARTIMAIIEIGGGSIDALIAALVNVEGAKLEASFGEIISTWSYRKISDKKPVLRVFVSIAHQLPDPGFLAEFIAFVELGPTKYSAEFQEQVGLLHMLPPESLAIATLASVGDQGSGRLTDPGPAWRRRLRVVVGEYLGEFGSGAGRRMNTLLQLPLRLGSIALSLLGAAGELIVGKPLRLVSQIRDPYGLSMLPEGHDPAQWRQEIARVFAQSQIAPRLRGLMAPLETSRIKESILAQSVIRKESPPGPVDSPRMFRRVLDRLSRGHLLASRSELVLTCMGDRDLLKAATDLSGQAGRSGDQSGMDRTTEQKDQQDQKDRDQLHRILPLKSIGASYGLLIVLSFLGNLVWLGALWSVAPSGVRTWLFPYGLVEGLAISICCASVQCLPNAIYLWDIVWRTRVIYYRILMCLVSPVIIWLIHQHVSDAAQSAGVAIPGSDYGWSGLHLLIPLIPILITNLLVPEWIAWWRGSCLLYPSDLRLRLSRLGSASVCVGLFVLCGFFVFGLSRMLPAEPASLERGSLHGIVATVQKLRVEDKAIPAPIGGHAGISRLYEIDLKVDPAENAEDRTLTRAFTRRVIRWPRNTEGVEVTGAIGQWFIPRRGQKVRLFLERRQNQNHTFADVAVPNGIDLITDPAQTFNGPQPVPSDDETSPLDPRQPMSFWEWLKMMAVFGLLFGVLPWIGIMFVPRIVSRIRRHLAGGAGNR